MESFEAADYEEAVELVEFEERGEVRNARVGGKLTVGAKFGSAA